MSLRAIAFALFAASATLVRAHGSVSAVEANGQHYKGPVPNFGPDKKSPVRVIRTLEPITDLNSGSLTCGPKSQPAGVVIEVSAGSDITFFWRSGEDGTNWPHKLGPIMLYAYKCPGSAKDCQPGDDKGWALIDAAGYDLERNDELWVQERFFKGEGVPAKVPKYMPDGEYLFRHEIIALHVATSRGPEFYASCTQVKVVGGQSNSTSLQDAGAELAAFPGSYRKGDPGLYANVFGGVNKDTYKMPGPQLFKPSAPTAPQPEPQPEPQQPEPTPSEPSTPPKTCDPATRKARKLRRAERKKARALKAEKAHRTVS